MTTEKKGRTLCVKLGGYIGESAELFDLALDDVDRIEINMREVNYINSVGVKNWVEWTRKFPKHLSLKIFEAPRLIVNQVSMVLDFLPPHGTVESLYVPFHCELCGKEQDQLMLRGKDYDYKTEQAEAKVRWPDLKCEKADCEIEADVIEMKYFAFLKR